MAMILAAAAGAVALAVAKPPVPVAATADRPQTVAQRFNSAGAYGDISEAYDAMRQPGAIVGYVDDVDLTGVPCRWIKLRNGKVYRTYNTDGPLTQ